MPVLHFVTLAIEVGSLLVLAYLAFVAKDTRRSNILLLLGWSSALLAPLVHERKATISLALVGSALILASMLLIIQHIYGRERSKS